MAIFFISTTNILGELTNTNVIASAKTNTKTLNSSNKVIDAYFAKVL